MLIILKRKRNSPKQDYSCSSSRKGRLRNSYSKLKDSSLSNAIISKRRVSISISATCISAVSRSFGM